MAQAMKRYRSFISYSQQDKAWGRRLHAWLETYRVPVGVIAEIQEGGRLGRFFRDEEEMPAATDIAEVVREAIETAESLIVICSPRSARSKWVAAEITHFQSSHPNGKLFAVIIDGTPNSGDPNTECFPAALRRGDSDDAAMPIEPVGIDVRADSKERVCARLAAGLLDVDFDDLWQRDRRRAERRQRGAIIALSAASAVFALLATVAVWSALIAQKETRAAQAARLELQNEFLAMLGEGALNDVLTSDLIPGVLAGAPQQGWTSLMQRGEKDFILAREDGQGRIFAVAHDGLLDAARIQNGDAFLRRAIGWLKGPKGKAEVVIASGHCEFMIIGTEDWLLPGLLGEWGYQVRGAPGRLDDQTLADAGVLIIGNAWEPLLPEEIAAIDRFVRNGGGVFLAGLGWSWISDANNPRARCSGTPPVPEPVTLNTYPMNLLGAHFGVQWTDEEKS
jgi:hypothetical protein